MKPLCGAREFRGNFIILFMLMFDWLTFRLEPGLVGQAPEDRAPGSEGGGSAGVSGGWNTDESLTVLKSFYLG